MNKCFRELVLAIGPLECKISEVQEELEKLDIDSDEAIQVQDRLKSLTEKLESLHEAIKDAV